MLYCSKCSAVCEDSIAKCPNCANTKLRQVNDEDYVLLHRADIYTAQRLEAQFQEYSVAYKLEEYGKGRVSYLYDSEVMPTDKNIYVRYKDMPVARGLSARLKEELEQEQTQEEEFEDMPPKKRLLVQSLSIIGFLLLIMLAVFGADAFALWLKGLLGI